jgi:radical SAM protein with 4Fe4S-binding SPASM domain
MTLAWRLQRRLANAARRGKKVLKDLVGRALPGEDREIFELRPFGLQLEFTNLCNANCVFCPYELQTRPHETMSDAVFEKAVADFVAIGGGSVDLTPAVGDALIHPKFVERVKHLRSFPQIDRITLTTNAILLDRHGVADVLEAGLSRINISVAGFDAEMYQRIYRNPGYAKVRRNIEQLLALNAERAEPIPIFLCLRPDRPWKEVSRQPEFEALLKYRPQVEYIQVFSRSGGLMDTLPEGMQHAEPMLRQRSAPCAMTYSGLMVRSDGKVQICACESSVNAPELIVGDIGTETLLEIWTGERVRALRNSFGDGTLNPNCSRCDYYYQPAEFHSLEMRRRARSSRRRHRGEVVRHKRPVTYTWQME